MVAQWWLNGGVWWLFLGLKISKGKRESRDRERET